MYRLSMFEHCFAFLGILSAVFSAQYLRLIKDWISGLVFACKAYVFALVAWCSRWSFLACFLFFFVHPTEVFICAILASLTVGTFHRRCSCPHMAFGHLFFSGYCSDWRFDGLSLEFLHLCLWHFSCILKFETLKQIIHETTIRKSNHHCLKKNTTSAKEAIQMSEHDILRKIWLNIVKKCVLVCIWFSKCGTLILWSECALLFPLKLKPSFSNRKVGVPTYPGKLVPGFKYIITIQMSDIPSWMSPLACEKTRSQAAK